MPLLMLELVENTDRELFLFLNGMRCGFFDKTMPYLTELWVWIPLFAWWLYELYKKYKKKIVAIILFLIVLIVFTDQGANLIKNSVKRYRPSHNLGIRSEVKLINNYMGGEYGFVSNHAANVFGVAFFAFFLLRPTRKIIVFSLFAWALFIGYSRIYLGVHYPLDIAGGALLGLAAAWLLSTINKRVLA
jgi:undecaprenyl-diphosphatase